MSEREPTNLRRRGHVVAKGTPSYRPARSPLVSMGPSLVEEQRRSRAMRTTGLIIAALVAFAAALVWAIAQVGDEVIADPERATAAARSMPTPPLGVPEPMTLAKVKEEGIAEKQTEIRLPVKRNGITAIGYDRRNDSELLPLEPEGSRANLAFGQRLARRFLATRQPSGIRWFQLTESDELNLVTVGARPNTDVYAPISGTVLSIADWIVDGEQQGVVVQIQPLGDGEIVVTMRGIDPASELDVGDTVSQSDTLIGTVRELGEGIEPPLSRYSHDKGSGVEISLRQVRLDQTQ
jgi:hypothetical protein